MDWRCRGVFRFSMTYTQPLVLLFSILGLIGLLRLRRQPGWGLCAVGLIGLLAISWPPVDWLLSRHLEAWYPARPVRTDSVEAIVVLSAGMRPAQETRPYAIPDPETYERCDYAAWLYGQSPPRPVLACGGIGEESSPAYSVVMRQLLVKLGVPNEMIWTEERSRSTYENALYGGAILKQHGIRKVALVVDVRSMLRAEACFRKQRIEVVPAPTFQKERLLRDELMPSAKVISRSELNLHESLGLIWYWVRGWI